MNSSAIRAFLSFSLFLLLGVAASSGLHAQCINSFPYSEDFETTDGSWTNGGAGNDWYWGTPAKRYISRAASGIRCWITGGLQNTAYSDNENSWLMSPCFDFTNVDYPYIRMRLYWETEKKYDGASFEYSTDGGTTWRLLGSNADNQACPGSNWFNTQNVTALGTDGWTGNIQTTSPCPNGWGGGSGSWVLAGHELSALSGRNNVRFRFRFAAGNRCNEYDGFAVDDIWIGELQGASAGFSFSCPLGVSKVDFLPVSSICGSSFSWNFGDPASGSNNQSFIAQPSHIYPGPGVYPVTLTVTSPGGASATVTRNVTITELRGEVLQPLLCPRDTNGVLTVNVNPAGIYQFRWSTVPQQTTQTATNLRAGQYIVDVSGPDVCPNRATVELIDPKPLRYSVATADARCGGANGFANIITVEGASPFRYSWQPGVTTDSFSTALLPGDYLVGISDANGCKDTARFSIGNNNDFSVSLGSDTVLCDGETLLLNPGTYSSYRWQDGSSDTAFLVTETGDYSVTVVDRSGCTATARIKVTIDCSDIVFPTAFTPNGDGRNDSFGPLGNRAGVSGYRLQVFGRWGQLVYETTNPFEKWDARNIPGGDGTNVYVWMAQYQLVRRSGIQTRKGTVLLMR